MPGQNRTLVSIVNWNGAGITNTCLKSLLKAAGQFDVLVIDNGSTEVFEIDADIRKKLGARLREVSNPENIGFGPAHNQAATIAKKEAYDFLILLNNDAEVTDEGVFTKLIGALGADENAAAAAPAILSSTKPNRLWFGGGTFNKMLGSVAHKNVGAAHSPNKQQAIQTDFLTGCCMAIKTRSVSKYKNLFDEDFFVYFEDAELSRRLVNDGQNLLYVPSAVILHNVSSSLGERSPAYAYYNIRNKFLFNRKINNLKLLVVLNSCFISFKYLYLAVVKGRSKLKSIAAIFRAVHDGLRNVTGVYKP